jgi:hypothetical protein
MRKSEHRFSGARVHADCASLSAIALSHNEIDHVVWSWIDSIQNHRDLEVRPRRSVPECQSPRPPHRVLAASAFAGDSSTFGAASDPLRGTPRSGPRNPERDRATGASTNVLKPSHYVHLTRVRKMLKCNLSVPAGLTIPAPLELAPSRRIAGSATAAHSSRKIDKYRLTDVIIHHMINLPPRTGRTDDDVRPALIGLRSR